MLVSIARAGLKRHAVRAALLVAFALVVGHTARVRASVERGETEPLGTGTKVGGAVPSVVLPSSVAGMTPSRVELAPVVIRPTPNPLAGIGAIELARLARSTPVSLGSVCFGRPNRGRLLNAAPLRSEPGLHVMVSEETSFGTVETVRTLRAAVADLRALYPAAPDVNVGDLSHAHGGYLRPHRSHQLGLDADLGYFYSGTGKWYTKARADNLDRELTWAFLKTLMAQGAVEYVFMDRSVQALLRDYALARGEDPAWLETLFESPAHRDTLIRHANGHDTHFHVRFLDPAAERVGRVLEGRLRRPGRR